MQTPNTANPAELSEIYVATGQALSTIGDQKGAMERFRKALSTPHSDRVAVRLAIAHVMAQQNHTEDAERQIALAFMEARGGNERLQPAEAEYIQAADIFRQMHEYELSITYLGKARERRCAGYHRADWDGEHLPGGGRRESGCGGAGGGELRGQRLRLSVFVGAGSGYTDSNTRACRR